jgi:hypothetical protein
MKKRIILICFSNGERLRHETTGTNPQIQRAFYLGRDCGRRGTIESLTIEK